MEGHVGPGELWELQAESLQQEPGPQSPQTPLLSPWATPDLSPRGGPGFSHHLLLVEDGVPPARQGSGPGGVSHCGSWGAAWDSDSDGWSEVSFWGD